MYNGSEKLLWKRFFRSFLKNESYHGKIRDLIIDTYLLLQSANTNLTSDDIVLVGTVFTNIVFI